MVKGRLASGFCSPTLTWAQAAADARVRSNAAFANFIVISPCFSSALSQATRVPLSILPLEPHRISAHGNPQVHGRVSKKTGSGN